MHSLRDPSRVGCRQFYRELGRCRCPAIISCTLLTLSAVPAKTPLSHLGKNLRRRIKSGMGLYGLCWTAILHSSCERSSIRRTRSAIYGPKFLNSILRQLFLSKRRVGESSLIASALFSAVQFSESPSDEGR